MKTRFTKTLAIVLTSICGASLIGGTSASAQTSGGFTATPLPPLPRVNTSPRQIDAANKFNTAVTPTVTHGSGAGRLLAIQAPPAPIGYDAPPVPRKFNATARIVRLDSKRDLEQQQTPTQPTQFSNSPEASTTTPPSAPATRVAQLPTAIFNNRSSDSDNYVVSFTKTAQDDGLAPELGAASPEFDTPETNTTSPSNTPSPENVESDGETDGLQDLETDAEKSEREMENRDRSDQLQDDRDLGDRDNDDGLDDLDLDDDDQDDDFDEADEDRPQRNSRQFGVWPKKTIREVQIDVRDPSNDVPKDKSDVLNSSSNRYYGSDGRTEKVFAWAAPNIRYQPLYFEDVALERYGQTKGLVKQPIVSAFKFLRDGALLPFNAKIDNPYSCDTPLGFCRPGSPTTAGCRCAKCQQK